MRIAGSGLTKRFSLPGPFEVQLRGCGLIPLKTSIQLARQCYSRTEVHTPQTDSVSSLKFTDALSAAIEGKKQLLRLVETSGVCTFTQGERNSLGTGRKSPVGRGARVLDPTRDALLCDVAGLAEYPRSLCRLSLSTQTSARDISIWETQ